MELRVLEKSKNTLRLEVINPDDTIIYPLINHLLREKSVDDARYITGHPQLDKPSILVRVKQGKPQEVVKRVALELAAKYEEIQKKVVEFPEEQESSK